MYTELRSASALSSYMYLIALVVMEVATSFGETYDVAATVWSQLSLVLPADAHPSMQNNMHCMVFKKCFHRVNNTWTDRLFEWTRPRES